MPERIELRILGPLELLRDSVPVQIGGLKPRQMLATLALHHGRTVSMDHLIEVLWPHAPPRSAVRNVHTYISTLRSQIGEGRLRRQTPGYRLDLGPTELDAIRFGRWSQAGDLPTLDDALTLWRGEPVEDLPPSALWRSAVDRLVELWRSARHTRARLRIESGQAAAAIDDLRALAAEDPLREEVWLLLVTALEATGRRAEALTTYADARRVLAEELGIEPGEPLRSLYRSLLLQGETPVLPGAAKLDGDAAAVLRGIARVDLGPMPAWVAAALLDRDGAQPVLELLCRSRLLRREGIDAAGQQRFALPALVGLLAPDLPGEADEQMLGRVLGGYLGLAERAGTALPAQPFGPGQKVTPRWPVPNADELTADPVAWFTAERQTLVGAVALAARTERAGLAWEFAHALVPWCDLGGHGAVWEETHRTALGVCQRTGDLLGEAVTLRGLGQLHLYRDHYESAAEAFSRSRLLYARLANVHGEAGALAGLGAVHRTRGELAAAQSCYEQALAAYVAVDDRHGQAYAYGALGLVWLARQDLPEAWRWLRKGLQIARAVDDLHRVAHLVYTIGLVRMRGGEPAEARACLTSAMDTFAVLGDAHGQAYCLRDLARLERGEAAVDHLTRALEIFERIGNRRGQAQAAQGLGELHRDAGRVGLGDAYLAESRRLRTVVANGAVAPS